MLAFAKTRYTKKLLLPFSAFVLAVFSVLRYQYGNDYHSYFRSYLTIRDGSYNPFEGEYLYTFLNKAIPSFYLLIAVISVFFLYVIFKFVRENLHGVYAGLGILIFIINPYLFLMNLSALRQCIAMCIFIISLKYLQDRKLIQYAAMIVLAAAFHTSALLLLPICFFVNGKEMSRIQTLVLVAGMLILLAESAVVEELVSVGLKIFNNSDYAYHFANDTANSLRATLLTGVSFVYVAINLTNLKDRKLICGKLYLIGLFFGLLAYHYAMFTRIQMYFDIFSIVALPSIVEYHAHHTSGKWTRAIQLYLFPCMILCIYLARYYSFFTNPMWKSFTTYHTIFEAIL